MKFTSLILTLSVCIAIHAQDNKKIIVSYDIQYNTEYPNVKQGTLEISSDQKESVFFISTNKNKKQKRAEKDEYGSVKLKTLSNKLRFVYANFDNKATYTTAKLNSKNYIIKEETPQFNWVLSDETKKIDDLNVQKATMSFRGRDYVAWYSLDYPLKFGPWKFHGLPGLIVEIYDTSNRYHWILKSIKNDVNSFAFQINEKDYQEIDLKEYVDIRYNRQPNFLSSKLPRGSKVQSSYKGPRNSIEIAFEWENEKP